jgi:hypothetical protein
MQPATLRTSGKKVPRVAVRIEFGSLVIAASRGRFARDHMSTKCDSGQTSVIVGAE